jgi:outer membrane protein OmpA-like peptidoglycan-associated protein
VLKKRFEGTKILWPHHPSRSPRSSVLDELQSKSSHSYAVYFPYRSPELSDESKTLLDAVAQFLKENSGQKITVEVHTDNLGDAAFNQEISQKRAEGVKNYLLFNGIAPDRIEARGMGDSQPIAENSSASGRAKNRRVVFRKG